MLSVGRNIKGISVDIFCDVMSLINIGSTREFFSEMNDCKVGIAV